MSAHQLELSMAAAFFDCQRSLMAGTISRRKYASANEDSSGDCLWGVGIRVLFFLIASEHKAWGYLLKPPVLVRSRAAHPLAIEGVQAAAGDDSGARYGPDVG